MNGKQFTVGDLKRSIEGLPDNMKVTFGSTRYSKRPLVFYRFKARGDNLLQIELNEIDSEGWEDSSEIDDRITVGHLREEIRKFWKYSDYVIFGSSIDGIPLSTQLPKTVLSFELDQE